MKVSTDNLILILDLLCAKHVWRETVLVRKSCDFRIDWQNHAKINNLKSLNVWGTGKPIREFLYVDDAADICIKVMETPRKTFNKHETKFITSKHR